MRFLRLWYSRVLRLRHEAWQGSEGAVAPLNLIVLGAGASKFFQQVIRIETRGRLFHKHRQLQACSLLYQ